MLAYYRSYNFPMAGRPPTKEAPEFGKRLAFARKAKGLSQDSFAKMLDTTRGNIAYYERKAGNPTLDFIQRCSQVLNIPLSELTGSPEVIKDKRKTGPPSMLEQRLEAIRHLPRSKQKLLLQVLDTFLRDAKQSKAA
jgi:transcriptional regulator with XRE-family HTH domain